MSVCLVLLTSPALPTGWPQIRAIGLMPCNVVSVSTMVQSPCANVEVDQMVEIGVKGT